MIACASCGKDSARVGADAAVTSADAPTDAPPSDGMIVVDAALDAPGPMITMVTCPATPAATITTSGFAFSPQFSTITVGQVVKFQPALSHDVVAGEPAQPLPCDPHEHDRLDHRHALS